jgi:non-specific serine/threonine protein kinase
VALIERRDRLVRKDELLDLAWPGLVVEEANLPVQVSSLRKVLGDDVIATVSGRGYRFAAPVEISTSNLAERARNDNLPRAITRFVGHEAELDGYERLIETNRLVTLIGVGGCGKTRLAVEIASRLMPKFPHGVWFIDLAPMTDADRLALTVATTLGLREEANSLVIEMLCEHLAAKSTLLVLDNCEHLLSACADLVKLLLVRAEKLRILATSREAMAISGEQALRVRSLSFPSIGEVEEAASGFEAVQLFVDRARLVQPEFALTSPVGPVVAEICRRLDGIPLAIELAAARTKVCSAREIRAMLDDRFRLLTSGPNGVPPRHQTLLTTIKWSFDLLPASERRLLERLSVFSGGWTLESAAVVAAEDANRFVLLDELSRLVDKSLIVTHQREPLETRYSMLETVRQYGLQMLDVRGEAAATAKRHLQYFVDMAERLEPAFTVRKEGEAVDQLAPELENIVQALRGCERLDGGAELGLRLVATLHEFWVSLGLLELGYRLTIEALSRSGAKQPSPTRARALFGATRCARFLGKAPEAREHAIECLSLARLLHDDHQEVAALAYVGIIAIDTGDTARGLSLCEKTLRLARERDYVDQTCRALNMIGWTHLTLGNLEIAGASFEESLDTARQWGDGNAIAMIACNLVHTYVLRGKLASASSLSLEALDLAFGAKSKWTSYNILNTISMVAVAAHDLERVAHMVGTLEALRKTLGLKSQDGGYRDGVATVARNAMSETEFESAFNRGYALTFDKALAEARGWIQKCVATMVDEVS